VLTDLTAQAAALTNTKELNFINAQLSKLGADATEEQVKKTETLALEVLKVKAAKEEALKADQAAAGLNLDPQFGSGLNSEKIAGRNFDKDFEKARSLNDQFKSQLDRNEEALAEIDRQETELFRLSKEFPNLVNTDVFVGKLKQLDDATLAEMRRVRVETDSTFKLITQIAENSVQPIENTITNSLTNLKFSLSSFKGFAFSILKDIEKQIIRSSVSKPLTKLISGKGGLLEKGLGFLTSFFHEGGVVGETQAPQKLFPASAFANAPKFNNGLLPDEFPAILHRGETVFPQGTKFQGPGGNVVNVNVTINSNGDSSVTTQGQGNDLADRITGVVLNILTEEQAPGGLLNQSGNRAA